ncbi:hypothetical protein V6x_33130 [Gimesia chilikensis]|uniref:DUF1559 domain-containing protein n=1 Tax=Gimesia chilikensis TaxID=2605989 RepID=A0A517WED5_9PLAN|nr:DUF1559 domain-containing protein [Gimesia chilikensis]QDU03591.1 hypothetical protein V6x_33130 [Gimesia chilikensis]
MYIQNRILLLALLMVAVTVPSGCQKQPAENPTTEEAATEAGAPAETAAQPEEQKIAPEMMTKAGEPMTAARYKAVGNQLKQIGLALHNLHDQTQYFLPTQEKHPEFYDENGRLKVSWRVHLLPYMDQKPLYDQFKLDEAWDSPNNAPLAKNMPEVFKSPDTPADSNKSRFRVFEGKREKDDEGEEKMTTLFPLGQPARMRDTKDGLSYTIMVVEAGPDKAVEWTKPGGLNPAQPKAELGETASQVAILKGDGSISLVKKDLEDAQWKEMIGPQDFTRIEWDAVEVKPGQTE